MRRWWRIYFPEYAFHTGEGAAYATLPPVPYQQNKEPLIRDIPHPNKNSTAIVSSAFGLLNTVAVSVTLSNGAAL
jgi:hypothetical protein